MIVQCSVCKRIRDDGGFRLPWPGELMGEVIEIYCPRCAKEMLARIQSGEFAWLDPEEAKQAANAW